MHEELSGWFSARLLEPTHLGQTDLTWRVPAAGPGHSRFAASMFHVKHKLLRYLELCITGLFKLLVMTSSQPGATRRCGLFSIQAAAAEQMEQTKRSVFFASWTSLVANTAYWQRGIKGKTTSCRAEETSL